MIEVVVVDTSAEARARLVERISKFQKEASALHSMCPLINVKPLSIHELRFHPEPHVVIMGRESLRNDLTEISFLKKHFLKASVIAELGAEIDSFVITEQMARLGVNDVINDATTAEDFMRKLILLQHPPEQEKSGTLIVVDAGKGGAGVTSIAAGMAEAATSFGKKTILVDLDTETQDLSRFLQAKPFTNENLDAILEQEWPILGQTVEQCRYKVWEDNDRLFIVPPPHHSLHVTEARETLNRSFMSFVECLDKTAELVIVDIAGLRGAVHDSLIKAADKIIFVFENDPASLYASVHSLKSIFSMTLSMRDVLVIANARSDEGLPAAFIASEIAHHLRLPSGELRVVPMARSRSGARWPASGGTMYGQSKKVIRQAFLVILESMGVIQGALQRPFFWRALERVRTAEPAVKALPPATPNSAAALGLPDPSTLVGKAELI